MLTDNLTLAKSTASLATVCLQPFISKSIWPARTGLTQYLTDPFPFPILTSSGFFVIGKLGKILIQIRACFFNLRLNKRLTASI